MNHDQLRLTLILVLLACSGCSISSEKNADLDAINTPRAIVVTVARKDPRFVDQSCQAICLPAALKGETVERCALLDRKLYYTESATEHVDGSREAILCGYAR